jgi:hypothetical protein
MQDGIQHRRSSRHDEFSFQESTSGEATEMQKWDIPLSASYPVSVVLTRFSSNGEER